MKYVTFFVYLLATLPFFHVQAAMNRPKINPWRHFTVPTLSNVLETKHMYQELKDTPALIFKTEQQSHNDIKDLLSKTKTTCMIALFFSLLISFKAEDWTPNDNVSFEEFLFKKILIISTLKPSIVSNDAIVYNCFEDLYQIAGVFASIINPCNEDDPCQKLLSQLEKLCPSLTDQAQNTPSINNSMPREQCIEIIDQLFNLIEQLFSFLYPIVGTLDLPNGFSINEDHANFQYFCFLYKKEYAAYKAQYEDFNELDKHKTYVRSIHKNLELFFPMKYEIYKAVITSKWFPFSQNKDLLFYTINEECQDKQSIMAIDANLTLLSNLVGHYQTFNEFTAAFTSQTHA